MTCCPERFNVARALVGTEGTCVTVLEAKVKLIPSPQHRALVGIGYKDAFIAADHVPEILSFSRSASKVSRAASSTDCGARAHPNSICFLRAAASCWLNSVPMIRSMRGVWLSN